MNDPALSATTQSKVFISYSRADRKWLEPLLKHLKPYTSRIEVTPWSDDNIQPGQIWYDEIKKAIAGTKLAVLLVSPDFLASDFIMKQEVPLLIEEEKQQRLKIVWFALKSCAFRETSIAQYQALVDPVRPLAACDTEDEQHAQLVRVCEKIATVLVGGAATSDPSSPAQARPAPQFESVFAVPYKSSPNFTGRQTLLQDIRDKLEKGAARGVAGVVVLSGLGGMGKTQTAVEYCHLNRRHYDFVFWIFAETQSSIQAGLAEIVRSLGLWQGNRVAQEEAVRVTLDWMQQNSRWLLVLDNVEKPDWLRSIIPLRGQGHILITSREQDFDIIGVSQPTMLQKFSPQEAEQLLITRTGRETVSAEDRHAVSRLLELLGYLPLAIEQAAAYIVANQTRFSDYLAAYEVHRLALLEKLAPDSAVYPASVGTTWSLNFSQIENESRSSAELLKACALLAPDSIPMELLAEVLREIQETGKVSPQSGVDLVSVDETLKPLRRYSLVEKDVSSSSVRVHRLVQEVLRWRMDDVTQGRWVRLLVAAVNATFPTPGFADWNSCNRIFPQAFHIVLLARTQRVDTPKMAQLLRKTAVFLHAKGEATEAAPLLDEAIVLYEEMIQASLKNHDQPIEWTTASLVELAEIRLQRGETEQAGECLQKALSILDRQGQADTQEVAFMLTRLAIVYNAQKRYRPAERLHKRALAIQKKRLGEHHPDVARTLNELAGLYYDARKYAKAESCYNEALAICRRNKKGLDYLTATTLNNLGLLLRTIFQHDKAFECYTEAIEIYRRTLGENNPEVAMALTNLASWHRDQYNFDAAVPLLEHAFAILRKALGSKHKDVVKVGELLEGARSKHMPQSSGGELSLPTVMERSAGRNTAQPTPYFPVPVWKRALDLTVLIATSPITIPALLSIGALIKLVSAGPALIRQERVGLKGQLLVLVKFRTMRISAESGVHQRHLQELMSSGQPMAKLDSRDDPRLIPFGRFLRRTGLDELPQLFHVLRGEMSVVGPRPAVRYEAELYHPWHWQRFNVLPGLTGLWQVSDDAYATFNEMVELDIRYQQEMSLWGDICIIAKTPKAIWKQLMESRRRRTKPF